MLKQLLILLTILLSPLAMALHVKTGAQLFSYQGETFLAVTMDHDKNWHTYWKNPGDAGMPTKIEILVNNTPYSLKALEWPSPHQFLQKGDILSYGYKGKHALFFFLTPDDLNNFNGQNVQIKVDWLACENICIPEQDTISATMKNGKLILENNVRTTYPQNLLEEIFKKIPLAINLPKNLDIKLTIDPDNNDLLLHYSYSNIKNPQIKPGLGLLTPFPLLPFNFHREKLYYDKDDRLWGIMDIKWEGDLEDPPITLPTDGHCRRPWDFQFLIQNPETGDVQLIKTQITSFATTGLETTKAYYQSLRPYVPTMQTVNEQKPNDTSLGLMAYLLLAFLGGLILNFMPCVLPVISIKLFGLVKHSKASKQEIFKHNLFYTIGVLFSFFVLALTIVLLKVTGEEVGWGFQLQSPHFLLVMILGLFVFAINMFGLFEFFTPGGSSLGQVKTQQGFTGDFVSGVIATILSTPCSAPFLGTALTFAFTSPTLYIFLIFLMIGLGLSSPFILTGFFPSAVRFLPRPGIWMENFKKFLGLSLLLTVVWLYDVFASLTSTSDIFTLNMLLSFTFFGFFFWHKISKNIYWRLIFVIIPLYFVIGLMNSKLEAPLVQGSGLLQEKITQGLPWEMWSPEKMNNKGELIFIDFTAKWCITCKANERLVINTSGFKELVKKYKVKLLLADWTRRDPVIGQWLKANGHAGVPAYFVLSPKGELYSLGETITLGKIEEFLKKAQEDN